MADIFDRLAAGPDAMQESDYTDWNEMVGSAPPDKFRRAAKKAVQQVPTNEYYRHVQPGVDGTDPLGRLAPQERTGIAESLIRALLGSGLKPNQIQRDTHMDHLDPRRMSPEELAALLQWTKQHRPDALGEVASQYREKPDLLQSILSNKALIGLALGLGAKILSDRAARQRRTTTGQRNRPSI